jgi:hypothetical protein
VVKIVHERVDKMLHIHFDIHKHVQRLRMRGNSMQNEIIILK